ncbi:MAG: cryptochrome/photolyase family protein [Alphaproteobacteria bacterium]|nr:cryptochrome/photolyase family protein [Alphaproteobacteria bacterium]
MSAGDPRRLILVLGDQLSPALSSLAGAVPGRDVVLLAEVAEEASYVRHHKQKLVLVFSAMRHFADELRALGHAVDHVPLDAPGNTGSLRGEAARALARHGLAALIVTEPGEYRLAAEMTGWPAALGVPVEIRPDTRFLCSRSEFARWARGRRTLTMEYFYRDMRRRTGLLMEGDAPAGGRWNFDAENRAPLPAGAGLPARRRFEPDAVTAEVMALVEARFGDHFGTLEGFGWPVSRAEAEAARDHFLAECLPGFGRFQDAMARGQPFLHHALVAAALNLGLLDPMDLCRRAEGAFRAGTAPLAAVEGFIRQILGWREYVRGIYWHTMPGYADRNALAADRPLPDFYWTGETDMACIAEVVRQTRDLAYAHHIQRLMVTGNFALLAGIAPAEVNEWYMIVYADAYEWLELPNTHGMALYADGGLLGTKPYAASGNYIDRMSDYCGDCAYDVRERLGPGACPFNYLYWDFLMRNDGRLKGNRRLAMPYATLSRFPPERRDAIARSARAFRERIGIERDRQESHHA